MPWGERQTRLSILGAAAVLIIVLAGALLYRVYQTQIGRPNTVVVRVGDEKFKLSYYADRLLEFAQANSDTSLLVTEQALLTKLEEEGLAIEIAEDKGIPVTDDEITAAIATKLAVPVGGDGSAFDIRYRDALRTSGMSDGNYRRLIKAEVADTKLRDLLKKDVGATGELVTIRAAVLNTKAAADDALAKVQGGSDLGTLAQTVSVDETTKVNDGIFTPAPPALLPEEIRKEIDGKPAGTYIDHVVEADGKFFVMKVEARDPSGAITEGQQAQLVDGKLTEELNAKRAELSAKGQLFKRLSTKDINWAVAHAGKAAAASTPVVGDATVVSSP
ncbi:hypothetical protein AYO38_08680 [bacterium SCGC AG-212-C10]|nr:hypothetical protein AYO38_08680 [bacterium SCGC AG-212-C10]